MWFPTGLDELDRRELTGTWWPQRLTWPERCGAPVAQLEPGRPSWCYGTPGITRALQLAGTALGDVERHRHAENALASAVTDPAQLAWLGDVPLCHGWSGTAPTVWCAAHDSTEPALSAALPGLTAALTDATHTLPVSAPTGLIQGSASAALTLHELSRDHVGGWARCLAAGLISGKDRHS